MKHLFILLLIALFPFTAIASNTYIGRLDNGMDVVMVENHSVPMIAANIIIKMGARDETWQTWGSAHFLEHLLFNGTETRTQDEIYEQFDRIGAYHNAHTGSHFIDFMLLTSQSNFTAGLDIMADMVFSSNLPVEKFEKERGIVIEEIAQSAARGPDKDRPFREALFEGSPLSRAVLGTVESIARLKRDDVLDFYHTWYVPNNMLLFVTGDFSADTLLPSLQKQFSQYRPENLPERTHLDKPDYARLAQQGIARRSIEASAPSRGGMGGMGGMGHGGAPKAESKRTVQIAYDAPIPGEDGYVSMLMLQSVLDDKFDSDLPDGVSGYTSMTFDPDLSVMELTLSLPADGITVEEVLASVDKIVKNVVKMPPKQKEIDLFARQYKADRIFNSERLHYYGIMYSSYWALVNWDEFDSWGTRLGQLKPNDVKQVAKDWLIGKDRFVIVLEPTEKQTTTDIASPDKVLFDTKDDPNSPHIIVSEDPSAQVFAMHILVKNRRLLEEKYNMLGGGDLLHRIITERDDKKLNLSDKLAELSATIKTADDGRIPYDNYYTSPEYSFIRFEMLADKWREGVALLAELMASLPKDDKALQSAINSSTSASGSAGSRPASVGVGKLQDALIPDHPMTKPVYGDVSNVDMNALESFRGHYFANNNLLITVSSSIPAAQVADAIKAEFNGLRFPSNEDEITVSNSVNFTEAVLHDSVVLGKAQGAIVMGKLVHPIEASDRSALIIANSYLNDRMGMIIREEHGLAYSLGSSVSTRNSDDGMWGLWTMSVSTRPENLPLAEELIGTILDDIATHQFTADEIEKLANSIAGRLMMRSMSRIGQAYSMGVGQFYWGDPEANGRLATELPKVTAEQVGAAVKKYLVKENLSIVIVK